MAIRFALTGLLIDRVMHNQGGRIVTVSSLYHRSGTINFNDLNGQQSYQKWDAYAQNMTGRWPRSYGLYLRK